MNNPDSQADIKRTFDSVYVAFLDVLGFKELVENNSHEYLEHIYLNTLSANVTHALANDKFVIIHSKGQEYLTPDTRKASVNSLLVSDSIIIWTENDSIESFTDMVLTVRNLMAYSFFGGLPLRGAIAIGPLTMQMGQEPSRTHNFQHTLFGKALVAACSLERVQKWSGCAISDAAVNRFEDLCKAKLSSNEIIGIKIMDENLMCRYTVPLESGDKDMFVVNWVNHHQARTNTPALLSAFPEHNKLKKLQKLSNDPKIEAKIQNTLKFVRHVNPLADKPEASIVFKGLL